MRLSMLLAVALAGAGPGDPDLPRGGEAAPSTHSEEVLVQLVEVDLLALDPGGRPVTDLRADEIRVIEGGVDREVIALEPVVAQSAVRGPGAGNARVRLDLGRSLPGSPQEWDGPDPGRWILLVFDNINGETGARYRALRSASRFVREGLDATDRVAVVSLDRTLHFVVGFTRDRDQVLAALDDPGDWVTAVQKSPHREVTSLLNDLIACDPAQLMGFDPDRLTLVREPESCYLATANRYASRRRAEAVSTLNQLTFLVKAVAPIPDRKYLFFFSEGFSLEPSVETVRIMSNVALPRTAFRMGTGLFGDTRLPLERFLEASTRARTSLFAMNTMEHDAGGYLQASSRRYTLQGRDGAVNEAHDPLSANRIARLESLRAVAASAGGRAFEGSNLVASLGRAQRLADGLYTLTYRADRPPDGQGSRPIRLRSTRPGVELALRSTVSLRFREAPPVRGTIGLAGVQNLAEGMSRVPLKLELDRETLHFMTSGTLADAYISLFAELMDLEGRRLDADYAWVGVTDLRAGSEQRPDPAFYGFVEAPPGTYWLRIRVTQPQGYGLGEMERFFSVGARPVGG